MLKTLTRLCIALLLTLISALSFAQLPTSHPEHGSGASRSCDPLCQLFIGQPPGYTKVLSSANQGNFGAATPPLTCDNYDGSPTVNGGSTQYVCKGTNGSPWTCSSPSYPDCITTQAVAGLSSSGGISAYAPYSAEPCAIYGNGSVHCIIRGGGHGDYATRDGSVYDFDVVEAAANLAAGGGNWALGILGPRWVTSGPPSWSAQPRSCRYATTNGPNGFTHSQTAVGQQMLMGAHDYWLAFFTGSVWVDNGINAGDPCDPGNNFLPGGYEWFDTVARTSVVNDKFGANGWMGVCGGSYAFDRNPPSGPPVIISAGNHQICKVINPASMSASYTVIVGSTRNDNSNPTAGFGGAGFLIADQGDHAKKDFVWFVSSDYLPSCQGSIPSNPQPQSLAIVYDVYGSPTETSGCISKTLPSMLPHAGNGYVGTCYDPVDNRILATDGTGALPFLTVNTENLSAGYWTADARPLTGDVPLAMYMGGSRSGAAAAAQSFENCTFLPGTRPGGGGVNIVLLTAYGVVAAQRWN